MAASIAQVQAEMHSLRREMAKQEQQIRKEREKVVAEHQAALEQLRQEAARQLEDDRRRTASQYDALLQAHKSKVQAEAEQHYQGMKAQYVLLEQELQRVLEAEQQEMAALQAEHAAFTEEYHARRAREQQLAEDAIAQTASRIQEMEQLPMEWFRKGYLAQYRSQLLHAKQMQRMGLYQSAVGIAESLQLKMELDRLDVEQELDRWLHYCHVLASALETEHDLCFREGRHMADLSPEFYAEEGIPSAVLTEAMLDYWTDAAFPQQLQTHLAQYTALDALLTAERTSGGMGLVQYLRDHPTESTSFSDAQLYDQTKQVGVRLEETMQLLCQMRRRIRAYDQRQEIGAALPEMLWEQGFEQLADGFGYEDDDKRGALVLSFEDSVGETQLDVHIIPIFSQADGQWYNMAGYVLQTATSVPELEDRLKHVFQDFFTEYGIAVESRVLPEEDRYLQQTAVFRTAFQMRVNGHLS